MTPGRHNDPSRERMPSRAVLSAWTVQLAAGEGWAKDLFEPFGLE